MSSRDKLIRVAFRESLISDFRLRNSNDSRVCDLHQIHRHGIHLRRSLQIKPVAHQFSNTRSMDGEVRTCERLDEPG